MKSIIRSSAILLVLVAAIAAFSDDQEKATKELTKVAAIGWDGTARAVVSRAVSDTLGVKRADLVQERQTMQINYASLYLVHQLVNNGAKMEDIATALKAGKKMSQVANDQHVNWKQIAVDAKKLNAKIDDGLYKHFLDDKADKARDLADNYDTSHDYVADDRNLAKEDIDAAAERYGMWKDRAFAAGGQNRGMTTAERQAAYDDHVRNGGPQGTPGSGPTAGGNGSPGSPAPSGGGARTGPN